MTWMMNLYLTTFEIEISFSIQTHDMHFFFIMGYITRPCLRVNWMRKTRTIMESILSVELTADCQNLTY